MANEQTERTEQTNDKEIKSSKSEKIKKGDFVEIQYKGFVNEQLFDTTDEKEAKSHGIWRQGFPYGQVRIKVGEGHVLKGLDEEIVDKEIGTDLSVKLPPEKAFGKKSAQMIKMIPMSKFRKDNVQPQNGMVVNIDGIMATIKRVGGGRVLVDFNHPLADKEIEYKAKVLRKITDDKELVESIIASDTNLLPSQYSLEVKDSKATIKFKEKTEFDSSLLISKIKENTKLKDVKVE